MIIRYHLDLGIYDNLMARQGAGVILDQEFRELGFLERNLTDGSEEEMEKLRQESKERYLGRLKASR